MTSKTKDNERAVVIQNVFLPSDLKGIVLIIFLVIALVLFASTKKYLERGIKIDLNTAIEQIQNDEIKSIKINSDDSVYLTTKDDQKEFVIMAKDYPFLEFLKDQGINVSDKDINIEVANSQSYGIIDWISVLLFASFIFLVYKFLLIISKQSSGGLMSFGKSTASVIIGKRPKVTFDDVAGMDEAKQEIAEVVDFLKDPKKYYKVGARIPKGVLLVGPPGTGKTLLAKAVAGEAKVPFFHTSGPEFEEMLVGAGAARVRDLFKRAKNIAPSIIFIDEIDAVAKKRGLDLKATSTEQTLNQILVEMDGFRKRESVIVIAATNRPEILDPAILRPGRFDRRINIGYPDVKGRLEILKIHARNKKLSEDIDLKKIAYMTLGFTGADLENLLNEAAILAVRNGREVITNDDIAEAVLKVGIGPAKKTSVVSKEDLERIAYHEAGHAILAAYLPNVPKVSVVSVVPRGDAGGFTYYHNDIGVKLQTFKGMMERLMVAMGGRIAEEIVFGKDNITSGASSDIVHATDIARSMVKKFGMSEKLGFVSYEDPNSEYLLKLKPDYSEDFASKIDSEVLKIINLAYRDAIKLLKRERKLLDNLAKELLIKETLDKKAFYKIVKKYGSTTPPKKSIPKLRTVHDWSKAYKKNGKGEPKSDKKAKNKTS